MPRSACISKWSHICLISYIICKSKQLYLLSKDSLKSFFLYIHFSEQKFKYKNYSLRIIQIFNRIALGSIITESCYCLPILPLRDFFKNANLKLVLPFHLAFESSELSFAKELMIISLRDI